MQLSPNTKKYLAEFAGTFCMVFCGTGAAIINHNAHGLIGQLAVSLMFGLIVIAMIFVFGSISGSHINPAVTIGYTVARVFNKALLIPYMIAQFAGALVASGVLRLIFTGDVGLGGTIPSGSMMQSFILEIVLTFILMLVILKTSQGAKEKGNLAAFAIGLTVTLEAFFAGPITGASMNPARSLGPALVSGQISALWIYLTAPVVGAVLASIFPSKSPPKGETSPKSSPSERI